MAVATPEDPQVRLRLASAADADAINRIYNFYVLTSTATFEIEPVTLEERLDWLARHGERYPVLVAESGDTVVGWSSLSPFHPRPGYRHTAEDSVYIDDAWRGRGLGRLLLSHILDHARLLGYHAVIARIGDSDNAASRSLHASQGFELVGIEREVGYKFDRWLDVVIMQWRPAA